MIIAMALYNPFTKSNTLYMYTIGMKESHVQSLQVNWAAVLQDLKWYSSSEGFWSPEKSLRCSSSDISWANHIRAQDHYSRMCQKYIERFPSLVKSMFAGLKMFVFNPMDRVIAHDVIIYEHSKYCNYLWTLSKGIKRGRKNEKLWERAPFLLYKSF